jgi:hypothetical protein
MPWELTGNAGTTGADFLGTTDNKPLLIKANNAQAVQVDPNGNVGIGTTAIYHSLQVGGGYDGNLGFDGSDGTPNAGYLRFGDNTGWKFHITRQRRKGRRSAAEYWDDRRARNDPGQWQCQHDRIAQRRRRHHNVRV